VYGLFNDNKIWGVLNKFADKGNMKGGVNFSISDSLPFKLTVVVATFVTWVFLMFDL
jgi:hypothetical protein